MRILAVGSIYPPHDMRGGYEILWQGSSVVLRERGHDLRVLASDFRVDDPPGPEEPDVHRELRWYWRDHGFPRVGWRERIALERHNAAVLDRHLEEFRPDAVVWWSMAGMSLALIERVRRAGIPAVGVVADEWLVWGPGVDRWTRPFRRRPGLARLAERLTGLPARFDPGASANWLFASDFTRHATREDGGWDLPDTDIVNPGIATELFPAAPEQPWRWRLLYLGRLDERKGVHIAIEALVHLPDQAVLTIQGSGDAAYVADLRARAERLGVASRVAFSTRPREELGQVYAAADAVLFPVQWHEPWGLVPIEAMAVGRSVVATGTGGSAEYLRHEVNALVYEPADDAAALAAAVERLAADPALRATLRAHGFATAARYTEQAWGDAIADALEAAASR